MKETMFETFVSLTILLMLILILLYRVIKWIDDFDVGEAFKDCVRK